MTDRINKTLLTFTIALLLTSCGPRPFKDGTIVEANGVRYKVESRASAGLVWRYDYYEEVTYADGRKEWVLTRRDQE